MSEWEKLISNKDRGKGVCSEVYLWVLSHCETIVGEIALIVEMKPDGRCGEVTHFAIQPQYRGYGWGARLLDMVRRFCSGLVI